MLFFCYIILMGLSVEIKAVDIEENENTVI